jgi:hypothetical protein
MATNNHPGVGLRGGPTGGGGGGVGDVTPPQSWKILGFSQPKRKFFLRSVRKNFYVRLKKFLHPPMFDASGHPWLAFQLNKQQQQHLLTLHQ